MAPGIQAQDVSGRYSQNMRAKLVLLTQSGPVDSFGQESPRHQLGAQLLRRNELLYDRVSLKTHLGGGESPHPLGVHILFLDAWGCGSTPPSARRISCRLKLFEHGCAPKFHACDCPAGLVLKAKECQEGQQPQAGRPGLKIAHARLGAWGATLAGCLC